jgi:uncharacterized membrane protein
VRREFDMTVPSALIPASAHGAQPAVTARRQRWAVAGAAIVVALACAALWKIMVGQTQGVDRYLLTSAVLVAIGVAVAVVVLLVRHSVTTARKLGVPWRWHAAAAWLVLASGLAATGVLTYHTVHDFVAPLRR